MTDFVGACMIAVAYLATNTPWSSHAQRPGQHNLGVLQFQAVVRIHAQAAMISRSSSVSPLATAVMVSRTFTGLFRNPVSSVIFEEMRPVASNS